MMYTTFGFFGSAAEIAATVHASSAPTPNAPTFVEARDALLAAAGILLLGARWVLNRLFPVREGRRHA